MNNFSHVYDSVASDLSPVLNTLKKQVEELLLSKGVMLHSVTGRVKSNTSFKRKVMRPDRTYNELWDMTDLLGLRIITYFEDAIVVIGKLIEEGFEVDYLHSENKLRLQDHEKFGYRSLHYVCHLPGQHNFPGSARFEIQIRTVLQHAWAEIEHDLGYKTNEEIPGDLRRRFSQVASLLEVADREFVSLRTGIVSYENSLAEMKNQNLNDVSVDVISLKTFIESKDVKELDHEIGEYLGCPVIQDYFFPDYLVKALKAGGLSNLESIRTAISKYRKDFTLFLAPYFEFTQKQWDLDSSNIDTIQRGYGLLFIAHLAVLKNATLQLDKVSALTDFYRRLDYPSQPEAASQAARTLLEFLKKN